MSDIEAAKKHLDGAISQLERILKSLRVEKEQENIEGRKNVRAD